VNVKQQATCMKTDPGAAPVSNRTEVVPTNPKEGTTMVTQVEPHANPGTRKLLYRVTEAAHLLSLSRSQLYELIRAGRLRSVKQGKTRLVPESAIREYVDLLISESGEVRYGETA